MTRVRKENPEVRPVVEAGEIRRPTVFVVDEVIVRSSSEERRLFWSPRGFEPEPWGDRP